LIPQPMAGGLRGIGDFGEGGGMGVKKDAWAGEVWAFFWRMGLRRYWIFPAMISEGSQGRL